MQTIGQAIVQEQDFRNTAKKVCSILRREIAHYSWVGIYRVEGKDLVLEAWDGPAATEHTRIPIGRGICGAAAKERKTILVDDVSRDPRYLQCFPTTKAEIVVPILHRDKVLGEIDIDSDRPAAFNQMDRMFLEWLAELLAPAAVRR